MSPVRSWLSAPSSRRWSRASSGSGSVGRASPCQGEGRGFESRLPLHFLARERPGSGTAGPSRSPPAAPSSSGRTADFGSVNRGSNPRGAATSTDASRSVRPSPGRRGEVVQHGGLQNLYSPVRIRSSPPRFPDRIHLPGFALPASTAPDPDAVGTPARSYKAAFALSWSVTASVSVRDRTIASVVLRNVRK